PVNCTPVQGTYSGRNHVIAVYQRLSHNVLVMSSHVPFGWLLRRKLTLWRNSPFSRFAEMSATSGPSRSPIRSPLGITLPTSAKFSVSPAEQSPHNQKYSVLTLDDPIGESVSSRNSCPSSR